MLTWVGKRPLRHVTAFPAQLVETFDPEGDAAKRGGDLWRDSPDGYPRGGLLFHGDNKEILADLLAAGFRGKVDLVYIDPPFDSGADYVRKVTLRGPKGTAKLEGENYTLGEQIQYTDIWANDNYLQFMYERLLLLRELLSQVASIYLECDPGRSHQLRLLLDEVFGADNFKAEIVWKRSTAHSDAKHYGSVHDVLLYYSRGDEITFNRQYLPHDEDYVRLHYPYTDSEGRRYGLDNITSPHPRPNLTYVWKGYPPPQFGWRYDRDTMQELDEQGRIHYPSAGGRPRLKRYLDEMSGMPLQDLWTDIAPVNSQAFEAQDFPTQKPEPLIERILRVSSNPGDLVLDCFVGSGTTAAVAQKLGRRWIACDINKGAIQTTSKRLQTIIKEQIVTVTKPKQQPLIETSEAEDGARSPAQVSFAVYRVNDYDLTIQHNEAVELACQHLGVTRTRTDTYFDGLLGKRLVKIVPLNHPLTLPDLEVLKRELEARPSEDRGIVLVCLGKEAAADAWIAYWNQARRGAAAVNRIEVIELRTDPKYGKFFQHQPASARVKASRKGDVVVIEIQDFISPTIVERLQAQADLLKPRIEDWRAMVDCVLVDWDHDAEVFRVGVADVPERKTDLVAGRYELPAARCGDTMAVKVIDMLGEEVLIALDRPGRPSRQSTDR
ncbi:MAG: site-specific DNA-methyltransferase [Candidatus Rokuibacteriota bacterium]